MSSFFPNKFHKSNLIQRDNRFVVQIEINGKRSGASLPNPGKLGELFIPGVTLYVMDMREGLKYPYRVIAVESYSGEVVMLDTHTNNRVAEHLLNEKCIPSLKEYSVKRREVTVGHSRFDFLLEKNDGELMYCEVKSCTLFGDNLAMFPDAITSRGRRHVEELAELQRQGTNTSVIFVIQSENIEYFLPDFHTDPEFSETLYKYRDHIHISPVIVGWNKSLELICPRKEIPIPWEIYEKEGRSHRGSHLFLYHLENDFTLDVKSGYDEVLKKGYYLILSFEEFQINRIVDQHKRKRKKPRNFRDYLRNNALVESTWIVRSKSNQRNEIFQSISLLYTNKMIIINEEMELLYFEENPRLNRDFQELLLDFRMRKLILKYKYST